MHNADLLAGMLRSRLTNYSNEQLAAESFFEVRAMDEFVLEQPWFRSMVGAIVHRHVTSMTWWKALACIGKSCLTAGDIGTDIVTGVIYYNEGDSATASMLFGLAGTSMFIQLMVVAAIHNSDWRVMFTEMLWTLTGLRSGLLHKRILTKEENEGASVGVITEAFCCKSIEVSWVVGCGLWVLGVGFSFVG
jgi:hypothetical protein